MDRLYCYADLSTSSPQDGEASDVAERCAERFAGFHAVVAYLLETPETQDAYVSPVKEVSRRRWTTAHLLVGDAAHATSRRRYMAQGVGVVVEDALGLDECLDPPGETRDLLEEYRRRRLPRTPCVQAQARRRDRTRGMPPGVRNLLRTRMRGAQSPAPPNRHRHPHVEREHEPSPLGSGSVPVRSPGSS
ncbi:hypothetical protein QQY66_47960 [Streptomyces sp. DG2A-72]|uniref:hypothetical protein n=1 Tax=Streptomyces sp. DG2A-72 TaxID=3051386 RepID=UPI00265BA6C1|nr:hypothetical protein [Streptomyces sp. DG2A-72]MDO0939073.1 hypothetical protein [Streptomyces sp. DG2A-72]